MRGADAKSDYHLVLARVKLKLRERERERDEENCMTERKSGTSKLRSSAVLSSETDSKHWPTMKTTALSEAGCS